VHGTTEIKSLGQPASHGCVRLHPDNAKTFYTLVKNIGLDNTLIAIVN
jgi:lipoprotein-anchoring transpeptidase ErfK/SrfK